MTAPTAYTTLDSDDLGANKILRAATMSALDSNPVAIAQRGTGAPWLNGIGAIESITSGSGNWTVPAGVYSIKATAIGGGGGSGSASTGGGDTTFGALTGGGGRSGIGGSAGDAGTASGGDINAIGIAGTADAAIRRSSAFSTYYGSGGAYRSTGTKGGGPGGTAIGVISVEPGDLIAYSVGSGGSGAGGGESGIYGIIIIEY